MFSSTISSSKASILGLFKFYRMRLVVLLLLATFLLQAYAMAQRVDKRVKQAKQRSFLMLQKRNKNKNAYYERGDVISFQLKGQRCKITRAIVDFKDSVIVFNDFEVKVANIKCLYIDEKTKWWLRYKIAQLTLITGTGYVTIDAINSGKINKRSAVFSGTLLGAGLIAKLLISNKIKIKGHTKLRVLIL
jgi:hypothetical protein